jgi:trk system potassium uptake protein TrkH
MKVTRENKQKFLQSLKFLEDRFEEVKEIYHEYIYEIAKFIFKVCGFISLISLTLEIGFNYPSTWSTYIRILNQTLIYYLLVYELISLLFTKSTYKEFIVTHKPEVIIVIIILIQKIFEKKILSYFQYLNYGADQAALSFLAIAQIFFIFSNIISFLRSRRIYTSKKLNPSLMFFLSFAGIILLGFLLLSLPKAHRVDLPAVDILFTVISATCVTGLSTVDVGTSFTFTGHIIILFLIQVGGLGLITLTTFFAIFLAGQASVNDRLMMKDLLSEDALGRVKQLIGEITYQTFIIESIGSILLFLSFPENSGLRVEQKIFYSIFHSISAFCNAGFSLFSKNLGEDFLRNDKFFISSIMFLVLFGGIGFNVISQIQSKLLRWGNTTIKLTVSTKLSLITSATLLVIGTLGYLVLEQKFTLSNFSFLDQVFQSLFYSVSTRTAGFNILDLSKMGNPVVFFSLFLMWVGASPNSTGGGIKTTTFALAFLQILNFVRGKSRLEVYHRTIAEVSVYRASATIVLSLFVIFGSIFSLLLVETLPFLDICYEVVSAYGTVGLSRGITGYLSPSSKITICITMFMGRVGVLTTLIALIPKKSSIGIRYPNEYVIVG